jgi:lysophospholipase L1-like esterase
MPPEGSVEFVGSSSIANWRTLADDFAPAPVLNRGLSGAVMADLAGYAPRIVLPYRPRTLVVYAGENDVAIGTAPEQVLADFRSLVAQVRSALPDTKVVVVSVKPSPDRWRFRDQTVRANALIRSWVEAQATQDLRFVDIYPRMLGTDGTPRRDLYAPDGLHLSPAGYAVWTAAVRPEVAP